MYTKNEHKVPFLLSVFVITCAFLMMPLQSQAITKHISIVGETGQPMANTTITITFQDGTAEEEDTDDKGLLIFNFGKKGDYVLTDPNGRVVGNVSTTGFSTGQKAAAAAGAAIAAILIIDNSGSNNDNSGDSSSNDSGSGDSGSGVQDCGASLPGTYDVSYSIASNPANHPFYISPNIVMDVVVQGSNISFFPVNLHGSYSNCSFTASSNDSFAGFSTTYVFSGTQNPSTGTITGTLTVGGDGNLPSGQPIVYNCQGIKR